ncbi:MAG: branched-chain amino acid ABC transporter permease [Betaproteobacteria bacterium HGW-Betaproteobacteria-13]|jgi:branched-chain amino acid transport system permease protein|uniref:Branched-chain amino acid ABC transporter permease n=1 Tax=Parazoarcus communis TaxID=41977 RepID=A0A2U8GZL8_9RHOO|nr:branched-chain amino acid ABC transporter permease [Parazoarcus communis]AWI77905.1 branched-chain amino acid ABC transporter permease [Parazoarcus communis]PKO82524.1 MAG: branched-chain amino acid ABC transporter permease [Betaproteobacteria bacterium HGW-Betaproteobacteria-13]|tara:strand:- start:13084 stop:14034 length:951 start_codon:yes stop_codon:yes gene_type:complete
MQKRMIVALALLYVVVPVLLNGNNYILSLLVSSLIVAGMAVSWALLGNLGGMVSFGHAAFFGIGGYASALLVTKLGLPVMVAIPAGGVAAVLASVFMLPALRLSGPYFALAILAYAHIFKILATEFSSLTGGSAGLSSIPGLPDIFGFNLSSRLGAYFVVVSLVLVFCWVYGRIRRSDYGTALRAMHDSEDATRVVGVNSLMLKSWMLFVSAFMGGLIGAFNAHVINFLEPDYAFNSAWSVLPIVAAIFGGYRTVYGPAIGAVVIYLVDQLVFKEIMSTGHQLILGAVLAGMILFAPDGLMRLFKRKPREARNAHA